MSGGEEATLESRSLSERQTRYAFYHLQMWSIKSDKSRPIFLSPDLGWNGHRSHTRDATLVKNPHRTLTVSKFFRFIPIENPFGGIRGRLRAHRKTHASTRNSPCSLLGTRLRAKHGQHSGAFNSIGTGSFELAEGRTSRARPGDQNGCTGLWGEAFLLRENRSCPLWGGRTLAAFNIGLITPQLNWGL